MKRFFDAGTRPPQHGWHVIYKGRLISASSESALVDIIKRLQVNNGEYVSDGAISEMLWDYWCSREPARCGDHVSAPAQVQSGPLMRAEVTPELQGPPIWLFLNTIAVQWQRVGADYFLRTCAAIASILECPVCRDEWRKIMAETPPDGITSTYEACQWVNTAHNRVNARKGKRQYPYSEMVRNFGAPIQ